MELIHPMTVYKPGSFIHYIDNNGVKTPITPENMVSLLEQNKTLEVHSRITPSDGCISPMEIVSKACSVSDLNRIIGDVSQTALETSAIISDYSDNTEKSENSIADSTSQIFVPEANTEFSVVSHVAESIPKTVVPVANTKFAAMTTVTAGDIVKAASFAGGVIEKAEKSSFYTSNREFTETKHVYQKPSALFLASVLTQKYIICLYKKGLYMYNGKNYDLLVAEDISRFCLNEYESLDPSVKLIADIARLTRLKSKEIEYINYKKFQNIVVFDNCVFNFMTKEICQHSEQYFITHALNIPLVYDSLDCPIFKKFISNMAGGDQTLYMRLLEATGYILSNDCLAKRFVALVGPGNTGKSAYGELIKAFFHSKNITSYSPQDLSGQFVGATLSTAALNICMDVPCIPLDPASVAKLKAMTGRDDIQGEIKFLDAFSYIYTGKFLFGLNDDIRITYNDPAFFDRVLYIPCRNIIPKHLRNPYLIDQMNKELPAIALLTLSCFAEVVKRNYEFTGDDVYKYSSEPVNYIPMSTGAYNDGMQEFIKECCTINAIGDLFTTTQALYDAYKDYCGLRKLAVITSINAFSKRLNAVSPDIEPKKKRFGSSTCNGYINITLK